MQLNLLVLRCKNVEITKAFYEKLGLTFIKEKHGKGVEHYSTYVGALVLELYPLKEDTEIEQSRLGFSVATQYLNLMQSEMISSYMFDGIEVMVLQDPDGRKVELRCEERLNEF